MNPTRVIVSNKSKVLTVSWIGSQSGNIRILSPHIFSDPNTELYVGVKSISTYNGFNNITTSNNIFTYTSNTPALNTVHTITLTPGIYNIASINVAIQQAMLNIGESATNVNQFQISIYTPNVGTTINSPFNFDFSIPNSINTILGFNPITYVAGFYISQNSANITDNDTINITCNFVSDGVKSNVIGSNEVIARNILYSFTVSNNPGGLVQMIEANPLFMKCTSNIIKDVSFTLTNKYDKVVSNPGQTFTLTLEFRDG